MRTLKQLIVGLIASLLFNVALAQDFPSKPLKIVVPFAPGGDMDAIARLLSERLRVQLSQPVMVENKVGAGGSVGTLAVARSEADGYTILMSNQGPNVIREILYPATGYRTTRDFTGISVLVSAPLFLMASTKSGINSVQDAIRVGRDPSAKRNIGSAGSGSISHIAAEGLNRAMKTQYMHIPYNGAANQTTALITGDIDLAFVAAPDALSRRTDPRLVVLAVASDKRFLSAPDVPTLQEGGVESFVIDNWLALVVPKDTPKPVIDRLNHAVNDVLKQKDFVALLQSRGSEAKPSSPEYVMEQFRKSHIEFGRIIEEASIKPE